jgi:outer membrane protein
VKSLKVLLLCILLVLPAITYGKDEEHGPEDAGIPGLKIGTGIVTGYGNSEYKGAGNNWFGFPGYRGVFPMLMLDTKYFFIELPEAGGHLYAGERLSLDLLIGVIDGFDPDDSDDWGVRQMRERKITMFTGLRGTADTPAGSFSAAIKSDVLGNSNSVLTEVMYEHTFIFSHSFMLLSSIHFQWADKKHNNYYYGVSGSESARSGIERYAADAGFTYSAELTANYFFTQNLAAMLNVSCSVLPSEVKNSPIVDKGYRWNAAGGIIYMF